MSSNFVKKSVERQGLDTVLKADTQKFLNKL